MDSSEEVVVEAEEGEQVAVMDAVAVVAAADGDADTVVCWAQSYKAAASVVADLDSGH